MKKKITSQTQSNILIIFSRFSVHHHLTMAIFCNTNCYLKLPSFEIIMKKINFFANPHKL